MAQSVFIFLDGSESVTPVSSQTATLTQLIQPITQVASKILILELILERRNYISDPRGRKDVKTER